MNGFLLVFVGGGLGAMSRHAVNVLSTHAWGTRYPIGTFLINVSGSFLIGVVTEFFALRSHLPLNARLFIVTGIIGGFTTFSAFSLEVGLLSERGEVGSAAIYAIGSVVVSVAAMFGGLHLVRLVN